MKLTKGQTIAYDKMMKWLAGHGDWCFRLAGYAGTGKTFLLQHLINNMDVIPICCTPTAKAGTVLESKLPNEAIVQTVHKTLYSPLSPCTEVIEELMLALKEDPNNQNIKQAIAEQKKEMKKQKLSFSFNIRENEFLGRTFIVDEASMITHQMARDFGRSGARVLFVGDPGQLPAVGDKGEGWLASSPADHKLTEIMRQALDSDIIRLSMDIRETGRCNLSDYELSKEVGIFNKNELSTDEWLKADQVLTGSNYLRRRINRFMRKQKGFENKLPIENEKLICLKNDLNNGLINGIVGRCMQNAFVDDEGELRSSVLFEDEIKSEIPLYKYPFEAHYKRNAEEDPWMMRTGLCEFDWAYAITVHKSQGSEWPNIILADDGFFKGRWDYRKRWLYTAITRSKNKFTWVRD